MAAMISIEGVTKNYGEHTALDDLNLTVEEGAFFGYLGPNGAGKTTTIKSIIGLVKPDTGRILVDGVDVSSDPVRVRSVVGYVPDKPFIYEKLTGREFLNFVGGLYSMSSDDIIRRIDWLCEIFDMHGWIGRRTEEYSHGMKQKVVMSAAFIHRPKLIIVDEPTVGLDPPSARLLKDMLTLINSKGTTIFISSHDLAVVEEIAGTMSVLSKGRVVAEGTLDDLREQAQLSGGGLEDLFLKLTHSKKKEIYLD
jgi:ABC-2 type transport system ATP-binding protein